MRITDSLQSPHLEVGRWLSHLLEGTGPTVPLRFPGAFGETRPSLLEADGGGRGEAGRGGLSLASGLRGHFYASGSGSCLLLQRLQDRRVCLSTGTCRGRAPLALGIASIERRLPEGPVHAPGRQQQSSKNSSSPEARSTKGQPQSSPLGARQQDEAEGARAQAAVELPYLPAPVPGCYLRVVHLQGLGSEPRVDVQPEHLQLTSGGLRHCLRL